MERGTSEFLEVSKASTLGARAQADKSTRFGISYGNKRANLSRFGSHSLPEHLDVKGFKFRETKPTLKGSN